MHSAVLTAETDYISTDRGCPILYCLALSKHAKSFIWNSFNSKEDWSICFVPIKHDPPVLLLKESMLWGFFLYKEMGGSFRCQGFFALKASGQDLPQPNFRFSFQCHWQQNEVQPKRKNMPCHLWITKPNTRGTKCFLMACKTNRHNQSHPQSVGNCWFPFQASVIGANHFGLWLIFWNSYMLSVKEMSLYTGQNSFLVLLKFHQPCCSPLSVLQTKLNSTVQKAQFQRSASFSLQAFFCLVFFLSWWLPSVFLLHLLHCCFQWSCVRKPCIKFSLTWTVLTNLIFLHLWKFDFKCQEMKTDKTTTSPLHDDQYISNSLYFHRICSQMFCHIWNYCNQSETSGSLASKSVASDKSSVALERIPCFVSWSRKGTGFLHLNFILGHHQFHWLLSRTNCQ